MGTIALLIPLLLVLVTLLYGVTQALVRVWLDYRVRMAFLDKVEKNPSMLGDKPDIASIMTSLTSAAREHQRQNYAFTGLLLAFLGVTSAVIGRLMRSGEVAVGIYIGGIVCVLLGLIIALLGFIIRVMSRPSVKVQPEP